jgi:hypothetical protein
VAPFSRFRGLYDVETVARNYFAAEKRARELLRSWLSLGQCEQYDALGFFEVVGSDTGKRYRIYRGYVFNVQELDADGEEARAWCFAPDGVATGDVMLAQKIALETFESKALAIANRSSGTTWYQIEQPADEPRSSLQWISRAAVPAIGYCLTGAVVLAAVISGIHTLVPA